jgi:hypothetical protein
VLKLNERLSTTVAQFFILTPGIVLNEALIEWLHVKINFLIYYRRSKKVVQDVWRGDERHKLGLGTVFTFINIKDYFWGK